MCCRLQLDLRELQKRGNGLFGSAEMTGSIGVVTINMARLGFLHAGDEAGLFADLDHLMDMAKSTLEKKRVFVNNAMERGFYPYTKRYLPGFNNHFSTIGVNGMNEMIRNFTDDNQNISDEGGAEFALKILTHMRARLRDFQEATGSMYNLEATPAEGATYRFAKEDYKRLPGIIQAGTYPNIYYTNSSQLPVEFTEDPFEALDLQNKLQCRYTGGTVQHLFFGEKITDGHACKRLVKTVLEGYQIPYITITPIFSICETHGYISGEHPICPKCGGKTLTFSRTMGYYRPIESYNIGKKGEHRDRKVFKMAQAEKHYE